MPPHSQRKPSWLKVRVPSGDRYTGLKELVRGLDLHTVCEEARCPNVGECWGQGTATLMILGETCTRGCRFCAVKTGQPGGMVDPREPENVGRALRELSLSYVVLTMVDRDDLLDGGAGHVAQTVQRIAFHSPDTLVETLVGDFGGRRQDIRVIVQEGRPHVFAHNVEVVPRLQGSMRDPRCSWERSVEVLRTAREAGAEVTKSSLMVGCGEEPEEVEVALQQLRAARVDVVTVGQYLRPTPKHAPVIRYVEPSEFEGYKALGSQLGFKFVASGPLVRSSYRAAEAFLSGALRHRRHAHVADRYGKKAHRLHVVN